MATALDIIAETRIAEAMRNGAFDKLPGAGQPLALDEDPLVPLEVRMACRVLKNAGLVPPEVEVRREIGALLVAIVDEPDAAERARALRRLEALRLGITAWRGRETSLVVEHAYVDKLLTHMQGKAGAHA